MEYLKDADRIENNASNSSSIVAGVFVAVGACLSSPGPAVSSDSTIPDFRRWGGATYTDSKVSKASFYFWPIFLILKEKVGL
jgi:hypothetical protein